MFAFDESLFAFAYATPPFAFALLFDRSTTRELGRIHLYFLWGLMRDGHLKRPVPHSPYLHHAAIDADLYAATLSAHRIVPRKARREPQFGFAFDESLLAIAYATPPLATAL